MPEKKILVGMLLLVFITALGCASKDKVTGKAAAAEQDIYEEPVKAEQDNIAGLDWQVNETLLNETEEILIDETEENLSDFEAIVNETLPVFEEPEEKEEFEFSPESIVSKQDNISISIDGIKYEIKSEYWGKITEITTTILNQANKSFKPKVLVLLYDEKDFKEEWLKPKDEINFDIDKLNQDGHITKAAIVNVAFDDINLTKKFRLILVDAADPANNVLVVAEKEFKAT